MFGGGFNFGGFGGFEEESNSHEPKKEIDNSTFYNILGVDKKATDKEIRKAYLR